MNLVNNVIIAWRKAKWCCYRLIFIILSLSSLFTGGALLYLLAPLTSFYLFNDWRFIKHHQHFMKAFSTLCHIVYLFLTDKQYRCMFRLSLTDPPLTSPDRNRVEIAASWNHGDKDCAQCARCCKLLNCTLLDHASKKCLVYDSFYWRYFNCGRYPVSTEQIGYYGCDKWTMKLLPEGLRITNQ